MFFKYSISYDILVLHVFCNAVFPCFVQWTIWPQRNKMIIDREIGRRKKNNLFCDRWKTHHACLSIPGKMRLYRWNAEKSDDIKSDRDYVDRRERWENSAVRTNEMEISFSFSFKSRSMSDDLANVRYMYHKYCIFPTLAIFLLK